MSAASIGQRRVPTASHPLAVNGARVTPSTAHGYAAIVRTWKAGDRIDLELPMPVQRVHASEKIEANQGRVALRYGPLVYNIEQVDQNIDGRPRAVGGARDAVAPGAARWRRRDQRRVCRRIADAGDPQLRALQQESAATAASGDAAGSWRAAARSAPAHVDRVDT